MAISKDYWLGAFEVTQAQFRQVMGYNPSCFSVDAKGRGGVKYNLAPGHGGPRLAGLDTEEFPVENISWEEAVEFCRKLSETPAEKRAVVAAVSSTCAPAPSMWPRRTFLGARRR